jgi:serine kinase of HPr protein (carbohydrate metabolism regulator)
MSNIHASCVILAGAGAIFGAPPTDGVLLLGESGAGKSSAVLRLLAMGAKLVADDRVELFVRNDVLWARPPERLAGLLEARGLGILTLPHEPEARIALAVQLAASAPRYPERAEYEPPIRVGVRPPLVTLAQDDAAVPEKILLAAAAFSSALFREAPP